MKNAIGLNSEKSELLAGKLNDLLANYQLFYINARGFHWNITGEKFFELHLLFKELYNDALVKVDAIAERIRTLDQTPLHSFNAYLKQTTIKEATGITDGKEAMKKAVSGFQVLLEKERELLKLAEDAGDEGTVVLMSDYIRQQEKKAWMYSAYLK
jgi:starvation-inducible DNA-binding protein